MKRTIAKQLTAFNQAYMERDDLYHQYAKSYGLSDTAFWLLYSIYEREEPCTQREICANWFYAPQTVNTAFKGLEQQGWLQLLPVPGNRKNKIVALTEKGSEVCAQIIAPLIKAEQVSFQKLNDQERAALLTTTQKHVQLLKAETNRIKKVSSEDWSSQ